jgi:hypothetical protein
MAAPTLDLAQLRVRNSRLTGAPCATPADVVHRLCAVQAQDFGGAKWAVALRTAAATDREVERAVDDGELVRTHVLRPTWHFVRPGDLRWLLALTAPRIRRAMAHYDRQLAIDDRTVARSNAAFTRAMAGGKQLTRDELRRVLAAVKIDAPGQRLGNLTVRAELDAVICGGPRRGKQMTYALVSERCPATPALDRDEALATLASRYLAGHGPAGVDDFAWWSGLSIADARRGIELARPALASRRVGDRTYWFVEGTTRARTRSPVIHLLPNYDEYLVAYKDRSALADASIASALGPRNQLLFHHIVLLDGRAVGSWRRTLARTGVTVTATLAAKLDRPGQRALAAAVARLGKFLELPARLEPLR